MNFIWKADTPLRTPEQVAKVIYDVAVARGLGLVYANAALSCVAVESGYWCPWNASDPSSKNFDYDSESDDGRSVGYYQQQNKVAGPVPSPQNDWWGTMESRMSLEKSTDVFLSRLPDGLDYSMGRDALGQRVADVQQCAPAYRGRYAEEWDDAYALLVGVLTEAPAPTQPPEPAPQPADPPKEPPMASSKRPSFNEFPIWSPNNESRDGNLPRIIALHTQEGNPVPPPDDAAERLGNYCANPSVEVSYHLYGSQARDGGVTIVDGVDTDVASWSVGNANHIAINYCFAGSNASWSREEWLKYAGNVIDVFAWYAVQDIAKYPSIKAKVIGFGGDYGDSTADDSGITDHEWVTEVFGWGSHTDVGPNFPADYFTERFLYWLAGGESQAPPPVVVPPPAVDVRHEMAVAFLKWVSDRNNTTERDLLEYLVLQVGPGHPDWPSSGRTVRDQVFYGDAP
jgi:hypothetical protein